MWFPQDIWGIIKSFSLNYQITWHVKMKEIIKNIPKANAPINGPRIIYYNLDKDFRFVRYLYHIPRFKNSIHFKNNHETYTIIVIAPYFHHYGIGMSLNDKIVIDEYWSYINQSNPY